MNIERHYKSARGFGKGALKQVFPSSGIRQQKEESILGFWEAQMDDDSK